MEKWLCWGSLAVAALFLFLFFLDICLDMFGQPLYAPFGGMDYVVDILGSICSGILLYLSWNALGDQK